MKKIFLFIFALILAFGIFDEVSAATTGCCAKWDSKTSSMICYPNLTKSQCTPSGTNNARDKFIPDLSNEAADCSGTVAKSLCKTSSNSSTKGCCSFTASGASQPQCVQNKTYSECNALSGSAIWQINDTDCSNSQGLGRCASGTSSGTTSETGNGSGNGAGGGTGLITFPNPLNYSDVQGLVANVLNNLRSIVIVLALIFIIIGGIMYITSAGDDKRMETAKGAIGAALIGLAIAIAAPSFLREIASVLGWNATDAQLASAMTLSQIGLKVLNFLLGIVGVLAIIMMVVGGVMYVTSAGDEKRAGSAKKMILYSIIGITVSLASLVVVKQVAKLLV